MSSLRNAVPQKNYRERPQPLSRTRSHPLLEKHKDYSLRARDFNEKKARLKRLREKARERNEDEFGFAMVRGKAGIKERGSKDDADRRGMGMDKARGLKAQDTAFLRMELQRVRRSLEKVERMLLLPDHKLPDEEIENDREGETFSDEGDNAAAKDTAVQVLGGGVQGRRNPRNPKHTVFVDSTAEQKDFDPAEYFKTVPSYTTRSYNRAYATGFGLASTTPHANQNTVQTPSNRSTKQREAEERAQCRARFEARDRWKRRAKLESWVKRLKEKAKMLAEENHALETQRMGMRKNPAGSRGVNRWGTKFVVKGRAK